MIELTEEQLQALDAPEQPAVAVDPRTGQEYLLIRREIYEMVQPYLRPLGRAWDNPADDELIRTTSTPQSPEREDRAGAVPKERQEALRQLIGIWKRAQS